MSDFAWWHCTLSSTCSLHFECPWHYLKVTAVSNIFNWKFYALIRLSWNFVGLLSTLSESCKYYCCWLLRVFKGDNWHFLIWQKLLSLAFSGTQFRQCFSNFALLQPCLQSTNSYRVWWPWPCFQGHSCVRIISCRLFCRFLSTLV